MLITMLVPMKRGGKIPMEVRGSYTRDTVGSGELIEEIEIESVSFVNRSRRDMSHIVDMEKLKKDFKNRIEKLREEMELERSDP